MKQNIYRAGLVVLALALGAGGTYLVNTYTSNDTTEKKGLVVAKLVGGTDATNGKKVEPPVVPKKDDPRLEEVTPEPKIAATPEVPKDGPPVVKPKDPPPMEPAAPGPPAKDGKKEPPAFLPPPSALVFGPPGPPAGKIIVVGDPFDPPATKSELIALENRVNENIASVRKDLLDVKSELKDLGHKVVGFTNKVDGVEKISLENQKDIKEIRSDIAEIKSKQIKHEKEIAATQVVVNNFQTEVGSIKQDVKEVKMTLVQLQQGFQAAVRTGNVTQSNNAPVNVHITNQIPEGRPTSYVVAPQAVYAYWQQLNRYVLLPPSAFHFWQQYYGNYYGSSYKYAYQHSY